MLGELLWKILVNELVSQSGAGMIIFTLFFIMVSGGWGFMVVTPEPASHNSLHLILLLVTLAPGGGGGDPP